MAEADPTLNDSGVYVGSATGQWSSVLAYDTFSNIVWSVDARVKTIFTYNNDPLNRLQSITYDTSEAAAGQTIHSAPSITYAYMPSGDITRMQSVAAANVSTETYDYDSEGRLKETNLVFANRPSVPALTEFTEEQLIPFMQPDTLRAYLGDISLKRRQEIRKAEVARWKETNRSDASH